MVTGRADRADIETRGESSPPPMLKRGFVVLQVQRFRYELF